MDPKQLKLLSYAITHGLARAENGGQWPQQTVAGRTGEMKSVFQFTPDTWRNYAGEVLGDPNAPLDEDTEANVVSGKVYKWLEQGYSPPQIASMWNAGQGEPDAYTGQFSTGKPSKGVNKQYNVPYDVPAYAQKVDAYTRETYKKLLSSGGSPSGQDLPQ